MDGMDKESSNILEVAREIAIRLADIIKLVSSIPARSK